MDSDKVGSMIAGLYGVQLGMRHEEEWAGQTEVTFRERGA